jgi:acetoin utilization deacetylase AcuC-like enzyme
VYPLAGERSPYPEGAEGRVLLDALRGSVEGGERLEASFFRGFTAEVAALARELGIAPPALVLEVGYDLGALTASVASLPPRS